MFEFSAGLQEKSFDNLLIIFDNLIQKLGLDLYEFLLENSSTLRHNRFRNAGFARIEGCMPLHDLSSHDDKTIITDSADNAPTTIEEQAPITVDDGAGAPEFLVGGSLRPPGAMQPYSSGTAFKGGQTGSRGRSVARSASRFAPQFFKRTSSKTGKQKLDRIYIAIFLGVFTLLVLGFLFFIYSGGLGQKRQGAGSGAALVSQGGQQKLTPILGRVGLNASPAVRPGTKTDAELNLLEEQRKSSDRRLEEFEAFRGKRQEELAAYLKEHPMAEGFTAQTKDSFALWSKGRFAVTGDDGKELFLEVDPQKRKLAATGSMGVYGSLSVKDGLEAQSSTVRGMSLAQGFATKGFSADEQGHIKAQALEAGEIQSESMQAQTLRGRDVEAQSMQTARAHIDEATIGTLSLSGLLNLRSDLVAAQAKFDALEAARVRASNLEAQDISTQSLKVSQLQLNDLGVKQLSAETAKHKHAQTDELHAAKAQVQELQGDLVKARRVEVDQLRAKQISLDEVQLPKMNLDEFSAQKAEVEKLDGKEIYVRTLKAQALSGELQGLSLHSSQRGVVSFQPPREGVLSRIQFIEIAAPKNTLMVCTSVQYQDSDDVAQVGVSQQGDRWFIVARYPRYSKECVGFQVRWFAILA